MSAMLGMKTQQLGVVGSRPAHSRPAVVTTALTDRRALLGGMASVILLAPVQEARAVQQSSLCVDTLTEEEDTACRRNVLAKDKPQDYSEVTVRKFELAPNVPVAELNDEYTVATRKLMDEIELYCQLDVYDKQRIPLIKSLKADASTWVAKYARGGSARSLSARRMYIATDATLGHLASNGLAPLPQRKADVVLKTIGEAREYLAKGI